MSEMSGNAELEHHMLTNAINFGSATSNGFADAVGDGLHAKPGELLTFQNGRIQDLSFSRYGRAASNIEVSQGPASLTVTPLESTTKKVMTEQPLVAEPYRDFTAALD